MSTLISDSFINYFFKTNNPNFRIILDPNKFLFLKDLPCIYIYSRILNNSTIHQCFNIRFHDLISYQLYNCEYNFLNIFQWMNPNLVDITIDCSSSYLEKSFNCACQLVKNGLAYIDDSNFGKDRTIEENLGLFLRMHHNEFAPGEKVLRLKLAILDDPIIYSINTIRPIDKTYFVCPSYKFINIIADSIKQITHVLTDNNDLIILTNWLSHNLNIHKPQLISIPKINIKDYSIFELKTKNISIQEINNFIEKVLNTSDDTKCLDILRGK